MTSITSQVAPIVLAPGDGEALWAFGTLAVVKAAGETTDGRFLICVYEKLDDLTILPVTAYEVPRPGEELEP